MAEEPGKNYVGLNALYNYGGVIVYDTIFDADEDIIISCLMSSPSGASNIETQDDPLLITENNELLDLNVPKDFDNFTVFLMDARVPLLTGGGASTACTSFTLSSVGNTLNEFWFSAGVTLTARRANHQFFDFNYDYRNFCEWQNEDRESWSNFEVSGLSGHSSAGNGLYVWDGEEEVNGKRVYRKGTDEIVYQLSAGRWEVNATSTPSGTYAFYVTIATYPPAGSGWTLGSPFGHITPAGSFTNTQVIYSNEHVMVTPYSLGPAAGFGQNLGWAIHVSTTTGSRTQALFAGSSAANAMPWDVEYWYPGLNTVAAYGDINPYPTFNNFNGPTQGPNLSSSIGTADRFNNPGAGLVAQRSQNQDSSFTLVNTFTALSGLLVMACYDRNGAFSLSGAMTQYSNVGNETINYGLSDYGNTNALTATQDKFAVRIASPQYSGHTVENCITSFPFLGSTDMPEMVADGGDYEIMRVGFRRRLQEVLIYEKENDLYEPKEIFYTGFPTNDDEIAKNRKVRVGISYNGKMPFAIKNFTVNAVSGNIN